MMGLRARSDEAKRRRRQTILTTADQLLRADGYDALTMNKLSQACGLAKGTLYLYFATREELLLALYTDLNAMWMDRFLLAERTSGKQDYNGICVRFFESFILDKLLFDLAARAAAMLEPHVPHAAWVAAKQTQGKVARRLGGIFCQKFGCEPAQAQRLAWAFLVALGGAQQRAINLKNRSGIPEDVQKLGDVMSCREVFLNMVLPLASVLKCRAWPGDHSQHD